MEIHSGVSFSLSMDAVTRLQWTEGFLFGVSGLVVLELPPKKKEIEDLSPHFWLYGQRYSLNFSIYVSSN